MVDVQPTNAKLRDRAVRIVQTLSGAAYTVAEDALARHGWSVKETLRELRGDGRPPRRHGRTE
jgi:N-acetylmuramic acid 6-phosphate etherase